MQKLIHILVNKNFAKLVEVGIPRSTAKRVVAKLRIIEILEVAVSDIGIIMEVLVEGVLKVMTFKFLIK